MMLTSCAFAIQKAGVVMEAVHTIFFFLSNMFGHFLLLFSVFASSLL